MDSNIVLKLCCCIGGLLLTGCLDFGRKVDYHPEDHEGIKSVSEVFQMEAKIMDEVYFYADQSGIDPFYYAKFKVLTTEKEFQEMHLSGYDSVEIEEDFSFTRDTPAWFNPNLKGAFQVYSSDYVGGSYTLLWYPKTKQVFVSLYTN